MPIRKPCRDERPQRRKSGAPVESATCFEVGSIKVSTDDPEQLYIVRPYGKTQRWVKLKDLWPVVKRPPTVQIAITSLQEIFKELAKEYGFENLTPSDVFLFKIKATLEDILPHLMREDMPLLHRENTFFDTIADHTYKRRLKFESGKPTKKEATYLEYMAIELIFMCIDKMDIWVPKTVTVMDLRYELAHSYSIEARNMQAVFEWWRNLEAKVQPAPKPSVVKNLQGACPLDMEISKFTGRCIKKCPPHKIRNPKTGRCVNKNSPLGRRLVQS